MIMALMVKSKFSTKMANQQDYYFLYSSKQLNPQIKN